MESLQDIYKNYASHDCTMGSDKGTTHSYLEVYTQLFEPLQTTQINILEIGIFSGAWVEVMHKYFSHSYIVGMDINTSSLVFSKGLDRVKIIECDATKKESVTLVENTMFDIIIDDGSHLENDILTTFDLFLPLLKKEGMFIIEDIDIGKYSFILDKLQSKCDVNGLELTVHNLCHKKGRFDDVIAVIRYK